jgi:hypothetical protein
VSRSLRLTLATLALALVGLLAFGLTSAISGPPLGARETERALAVWGEGKPGSYRCERLWLDEWDYRCRFENAAMGWIFLEVRVDRDGIVERSVNGRYR